MNIRIILVYSVVFDPSRSIENHTSNAIISTAQRILRIRMMSNHSLSFMQDICVRI
jgi:hypothetical protein